MKIICKKLPVILSMVATFAISPTIVAQTEGEGKKIDHLLGLMEELHATVPWYYEFSEHSESKFKIPGEVIKKVISKDFKKQFVRMGAKAKLSAMGAEAWPVVSLLLMDVVHSENVEVAVFAADILATIKAEQHPDWLQLKMLLHGQSGATYAFQHLLTKKRLNEPPYELFHRQFGLIGLAAIGPAAAVSIPEIEKVLHHKEDHALWGAAMKALVAISGNVTQPAQFLMTVVQDTEEWPRIRASAIKSLAISLSDAPKTREILYSGLKDEMSIVRLAAAQEVWRLNGKSDEVLPTLKTLLQSKLASVRAETLTTLFKMGQAANPIHSEVEKLKHDAKESVRLAAVKTLAEINPLVSKQEKRP